MAKIKIDIEADATQAQERLGKLSEEMSYTSATYKKLRAEMAKLNQALKQGTTKDQAKDMQTLAAKSEQYANAINQAIGKNDLLYDGTERLTKTISMLKKEMAELSAAGLNKQSESIKEALNKTEELYRAQQEGAKKTASEQSKLNEQIEKARLEALGDKAGLLRMRYQELDEKLRLYLKDEKKNAESIKKTAAEMTRLQKEMDKVGKVGFANRMANLVKSFVSTQVAVLLIRKALSGLIGTFRESSKTASQAEETYNLFTTTFENVSATAERAAKTLSSTLGTAESTMQKALGTFGDLLAGYGATDKASLEFARQAAQTAMDIVSYKNVTGDLSETFSNIASGLAGNVENFRRLGYIITQAEVKTMLAKKGLDKLSGSALQQAMVQERLNILIEKSYKAQGDMVKTLESTENVTRRLTEANKEYKEWLGGYVNAYLTPIKRWWLDILETINKAHQAQESLANGNLVAEIYDLNSAKDFERLVDSISKKLNSAYDSISANDLVTIMRSYNATVEDMSRAFDIATSRASSQGEMWAKSNKSSLMEILGEERALIDEELKASDALEDRKNRVQELDQAYLSFIETLSDLNGVNVLSSALIERMVPSASETKESLMQYEKAVASDIKSVISMALYGIKDATLDTFADSLDVILHTWSEDDALEKKLEALKSLYEAAQNEFLTNSEFGEDGIALSNDEISRLQTIASVYEEISREAEARAEASEEAKKAEDEMASILERAADAIESIAEKERDYAKALLDTIRARNIRASMSGSPEAIVSNEIDRAGAIAEIYELSEAAQKAAQEIKDEAERAKKLAAIETETENALDTLNRSFDELAADIRANALSDALSDISDEMDSWQKEIADYRRELEIRGQNPYAAENIISNEIERSGSLAETDTLFDELKAALDPSQFEELSEAFKKLQDSVNDYYNEIEKSLVEENQANIKNAIENMTLASEKAGASEKEPLWARAFSSDVRSWAVSEFESVIKTLEEQRDILIANGMLEEEANRLLENASIIAQGNIYNAAYDMDISNIRDQLLSALGPIGEITDRIIELSQQMSDGASMVSGLISLIIYIIEQLEVGQEILDIFAKYIAPALNRILKPFMPMLEMIGELSKIVFESLEPLIPLIKILSTVFTYFAGALNIVVGFISDCVDWLIKAVTFQWGSMPDIMGNAKSRWDQMNEMVRKIWENTDEIEENTSESDDRLRYLNELRQKGVIDEYQYGGLAAEIYGRAYDNTRLLSDGSIYHQRADGDYIHQGNVIITINGAGMSAEEIAQAVIEAQRYQVSGGGNSYITGLSAGRKG